MPSTFGVANLGITIDGIPQELTASVGDVTMSTIWPGGSDQLTWTQTWKGLPTTRFAGGEDIRACLGPLPVWAGTLTEPDPSAGQFAAIGAWQDVAQWPALDGSGNATKIPNTALDVAIAAGLNWTRPTTLSTTAVDIDTSSGPVMIGALLDAWALAAGVRWGVDAYRQVIFKADDTTPTWQTYPLDGGLGFDLTNYVSTLVGRYFNGTTYATLSVDGDNTHGAVRKIVDLTGRGTLTPAKVTTILTAALAQLVAVPGYTQGIGNAYGDILTMGGTPTMLETVAAQGALLRVHGGWDLPQRLNSALYLDVPVGRTSLADGLLTVQMQTVTELTIADMVAALPAKHLTA